MLSPLLFKDKLTILFCLLDDFLTLLPKPNRALISGRPPSQPYLLGSPHPGLIPFLDYPGQLESLL